MLHDPSAQFPLHHQLAQLLAQTLGQALSVQDCSTYTHHVEIIQPAAGKRFWQSDAAPGIYIVLSGKVRLLDANDELLASLEVGESFGELTLFPEDLFKPYSARASAELKLGYLPASPLHRLMQRYPDISTHLYQKATLWELLLLCRQTPLLQKVPVRELTRMLPFFQRHSLAAGILPGHLHHQKLWLIHHGELLHPSGTRLQAGNVYLPSRLTEPAPWQVTYATELYTLNDADWQMVLPYAPQLAEQIEENWLQSVVVQPTPVARRSLQSRLTPPSPPRQRRSPHSAYFPSPQMKVGHWWQQVTRRYPFYAQQSASDCGAACLVMIGRYWNKRFSVNRLRDMANVDRNGASLRGLAASAETIGFSTRPVKASLDQLAKQPLPAIVHWEGNHYIVVYEVTRDRVIVGDPAIGQRVLSHAQFKQGWTGYALLLQPTALLQQAEEAKQTFWQFFELVKPHGVVLLEVFLASVLIQLFGLITPVFTQLLLDRVVVQGSTLTLTAVGLGLLIFGIFRVAMSGLRQYLLDHTARGVDLALVVGFIQHTFRLPLSFFESRYVGDIVSRVQENLKIQRFLTGEALSILLDLLTVFVYVGLMVWYSWQLALLVLVVVPLFFLLALIATPFLQRISREIFNALVTESSFLIEALSGIRTVKSMAVEQTVRWRWEELLNKSIKTTFSGQVISNQLQILSATIEMVTTTALLWFGAWLVIRNQLTIGQLVAFNMLLGSVINPFQRLTVLWNEFQEVVIAVERINDVLEAEPEEGWKPQAYQRLPQVHGHICFENVTFRYHPESTINVLENLSFEVQPGQTVAIVGRSGSGKTTVAKLVLALYTPTDGKILIDGYDITTIARRSLRQQIGVVDQDTFLFGNTIRENISLGHPEATLEEIIEAARQAGADPFIQQLPLGYETQIGEGGGSLSGGQRQRLAIARALLGNPRLLILDEATSNLDAESERIIQTNLNSFLKGRTTLIIAHRLSTVRQADLILVLDKGVLVEAGTHDELMAEGGQYFYLNQQQLVTAA
ncbi:peptidase domain-containing ABC transporter [Oculatella sp. LEGE 06141]|uniref:peptidase domain-containing ABC transporter n=1 Tax=Oculatella sp. LEGE 06141 TaxID=1828648 RepID=UPI0018822962|nr:peptidase domain-containing ABC transporter [Oculatella sp. LEGE 06141]MBE9181634.1 peptidase domain-containing ABC transporter [Oculatella sp. LEGE 06141]